jgi:hypothetical protein
MASLNEITHSLRRLPWRPTATNATGWSASCASYSLEARVAADMNQTELGKAMGVDPVIC